MRRRKTRSDTLAHFASSLRTLRLKSFGFGANDHLLWEISFSLIDFLVIILIVT